LNTLKKRIARIAKVNNIYNTQLADKIIEPVNEYVIMKLYQLSLLRQDDKIT